MLRVSATQKNLLCKKRGKCEVSKFAVHLREAAKRRPPRLKVSPAFTAPSLRASGVRRDFSGTPSWPCKPSGLVVSWSRNPPRLCGPLSRLRGRPLVAPTRLGRPPVRYRVPAIRASMPPSGVLAFRAGATRCHQGRLFAALPRSQGQYVHNSEQSQEKKFTRVVELGMLGAETNKPLAGGAGGAWEV